MCFKAGARRGFGCRFARCELLRARLLVGLRSARALRIFLLAIYLLGTCSPGRLAYASVCCTQLLRSFDVALSNKLDKLPIPLCTLLAVDLTLLSSASVLVAPPHPPVGMVAELHARGSRVELGIRFKRQRLHRWQRIFLLIVLGNYTTILYQATAIHACRAPSTS